MTIAAQLRERLRKAEALYVGAATPGERVAAGAAVERLRARLAELGRQAPPIEMRFTLQDPWSARLLIALCRRWGLQPFRYPRQRQTTVIVRAPRDFLERVLWPRFQELHDDMKRYFERTTDDLIRRAIYEDISDAPIRPEPRQRR